MRILTTHVGSLPRPDDLVALLRQHDAAGSAAEALAARARSAVDDAVRAQVAAGIDIVNDGEQGRTDYSTYIKDRLTGFEGEHADQVTGADLKEFPEFAARRRASVFRRPTCTGPIAWKDFGAVERDIRGLAESARRAGADNVFMTAVSPGQAARFLLNRHYPTDEAYVGALADVLKREYAAIVGAGLVLQLDCPDLASGRNNQFQHLTLRQFQKVAAMHVEALNHAVAGLPPERMRLHICWGNYEGPTTATCRCGTFSRSYSGRGRRVSPWRRPTHATRTSGAYSRRCGSRPARSSSRACSTRRRTSSSIPS